jgi:hypothetical protein
MTYDAKSLRERMKAKAHERCETDPHKKVDASDWTDSRPFEGGEQTGAAPVTKRKFKAGGAVEGERAEHHAGRKPRAKGGWIQKAIKHPGALHEELHVKKGEKIPEKRLVKAEHSSNPKLAKRAKFAEELKGFNRAKGGKAERNSDEKEDEALIKKMVDPKSIRKGYRFGQDVAPFGVHMFAKGGEVNATDDIDDRYRGKHLGETWAKEGRKEYERASELRDKAAKTPIGHGKLYVEKMQKDAANQSKNLYQASRTTRGVTHAVEKNPKNEAYARGGSPSVKELGEAFKGSDNFKNARGANGDKRTNKDLMGSMRADREHMERLVRREHEKADKGAIAEFGEAFKNSDNFKAIRSAKDAEKQAKVAGGASNEREERQKSRKERNEVMEKHAEEQRKYTGGPKLSESDNEMIDSANRYKLDNTRGRHEAHLRGDTVRADGGRAGHGLGCNCKDCYGGRAMRARGGLIDKKGNIKAAVNGPHDKHTAPRSVKTFSEEPDRSNYAKGGKASGKGKMQVNIVIASPDKGQPPMMPPAGPSGPAGLPPGMSPGAVAPHPMMPPSGGAPPIPGQMPMGRG